MRICCSALVLSFLAGQAVAQDISFIPDDVDVEVCTPFNPCPLDDRITTEYWEFGVDFTATGDNPTVAVYNDPPLQWAGVTNNRIDLVTEVNGRVVLPNSTTQGLTDFVSVAAGIFTRPKNGLLEVFDINGDLLASREMIDGELGERLIATIDLDGDFSIASFRLGNTVDTDRFGVRRIELNSPIAVPTPGGATLFLIGGAVLGRRRR